MVTGTQENYEICGFCTEYDNDDYYCPHQGEMYPEDTCDGFTGDDQAKRDRLEAQATDVAERETHRREVEGEIE